MALVGGRVVMVPASLGFGRQADGLVRADLTLVAADVRNGKVVWRSAPAGSGVTPAEALAAALAAVLPLDTGGP
jgi:hypothetical protein